MICLADQQQSLVLRYFRSKMNVLFIIANYLVYEYHEYLVPKRRKRLGNLKNTYVYGIPKTQI